MLQKHKCIRIKLLGDCYEAVCGIPDYTPDHADNCVEMGLEMIGAIRYVCCVLAKYLFIVKYAVLERLMVALEPEFAIKHDRKQHKPAYSYYCYYRTLHIVSCHSISEIEEAVFQ